MNCITQNPLLDIGDYLSSVYTFMVLHKEL